MGQTDYIDCRIDDQREFFLGQSGKHTGNAKDVNDDNYADALIRASVLGQTSGYCDKRVASGYDFNVYSFYPQRLLRAVS